MESTPLRRLVAITKARVSAIRWTGRSRSYMYSNNLSAWCFHRRFRRNGIIDGAAGRPGKGVGGRKTMYTHPQQGLEQDDVQRLRQEAGRWLRSLREKAGYSQRELARVVGLEYYTFISQIES